MLLFFLFLQVLRVGGIGVGVETASDERVGGSFTLANKHVTLEHFDAGCSAHDAGEKWRMVDVGVTSEW